MIKVRKMMKNHLFMSAFYKGVSGLSLFMTMPLLIRYLGNTNYGVWILVFTLFQWVLLMDFGLSSVLKTKIPELYHVGKFDLINAYIKVTYKICCWIALFIFLSFLILFLVLDIRTILNINFESSFVSQLFLLNVFFFCVNFILNTHKALFVGVHKGKFAEQSIAVNQLFFLFALFIPIVFFKNISNENKLFLISCVNGLTCLVVNLIYSLYLFQTEKFSFKTNEKVAHQDIVQIYKMGFKYMAIQIGTLFLFSSDNYILSYYFGPKDIVPYEIVSKYFQFPLMILTAGMSPLWSMFTKNYLEKNTFWIKSVFKKFNYFYILILGGMILSVFIAPYMMKVWIGKNFTVSIFLLSIVSLMISLRIFSTFYSYFFNGIGNLRTYLLLLITSVILKIPLSYLFIKLHFGISSVVLASSFCLLFWCIAQPIEAYKIISKLNKK